MMDKEKIKRNQHYLPKAYLQFFSHVGKKEKMTYAYFLDGKKEEHISIENICNQSYLYEEIAIDPETGEHIFLYPNEIENSFIPLEGEYATIIRSLLTNLDTYGEPRLSADESDILKHFIASIIARDPIFVHLSNYIVRTMYDKNDIWFQQLKEKVPEILDGIVLSMIANKILKLNIHPEEGILLRALKATMDNSKLCVIKTDSPVFVTSDSPVVNIYGENDDVEFDLLGMPITPNLFLAFVDSDENIPEFVITNENETRLINNRQIRKKSKLLISSEKDILSYIDIDIDIESDCDENQTDGDWIFDMLQVDKDTFLKKYSDFKNSKDDHYWK